MITAEELVAIQKRADTARTPRQLTAVYLDIHRLIAEVERLTDRLKAAELGWDGAIRTIENWKAENERLRRVAEAVERGWTCTAAASEDCYCGVLDEAVAAWKEGRDE